MPLQLEDGSGVPGANSFVSLVQARDYATLRGVTLPADGAGDAALTAFLVKAMDYLKVRRYLGSKTYAGEAYLPFPRSGLEVDGEDFPSDEVPQALKDAQCQLCIEQQNGVDLTPSMASPAIKREKIGPIDTEYVTTSSGLFVPKMPSVEAILSPWLNTLAISLRTLRV